MAKGKKPVATPPTTQSRGIPSPKAPLPKKWTFSFRYWRQIEFFGLDKCKPNWCASFLERLAELSTLDIDDFLSDRVAKNRHRYHPIDWDHTNVPIAREGFNWIDNVYRDNPEDYPFMQFMVSKALGRVVGFWDESEVFNVVLVDPLHNIQPSRDFNYKVDPCSPMSCEVTALHIGINAAKAVPCIADGCPAHAALHSLEPFNGHQEVIVIPVEPGATEWVAELVATNKVASATEIFENGILQVNTDAIGHNGQ